ncbi:zinc dependent phospholipase C family protein [Arcticibacter sp. MXS-1]|uniref:zinc dependent phospholipase C family protein n=1 Tax=Arcticibacter sp. MXS-1 TaxID=3341726 RepID=UPI0035A8FFF0
MARRLYISVTLLTVSLFCSSWGFFGHHLISRMAVFTLPPPMIRFYKNNLGYITRHSVDPDKKRYLDPLEGARHFIDSERYGESPFDSIPEKWSQACLKYTEDTLRKYGTVPWQIEKTYYQLVSAFDNRDSLMILKLSAHLSHYISDAHVPLHVTSNYNGQLSGQLGIHAFWESRLPELFSKQYNFMTGRAKYIESPIKEAWSILRHTLQYKDSVFAIEKRVAATFPSDHKYNYSERNGKVIRQYSAAYSKAFHDALSGMVEQQMRSAVYETGCFWYSAWVDAGQPALSSFPSIPQRRQKDKEDPDLQIHSNKNILGRPDL